MSVTAQPELRKLDKLMSRLQMELRDYRRAFRSIAKGVLIPSVKRSFARDASQEGEKWAPLTAEYARKKAAGGGSKKVLELSGKLKKSMTRVGRSGGGVRIFGKRFMRFGTEEAYSVPLHWGYGARSLSARRARSTGRQKSRSKRRRSDIEARPFSVWNNAMTREAFEAIVEHLEDRIGNSAKILAARRARIAATGGR